MSAASILTSQGIPLKSIHGIQFQETIVHSSTKLTPKRHFGILPGGEEEKPKGPLVVYSFIVPVNSEDKVNYKEQQTLLRKALRSHIPKGLLLETREKGVLFPVIHFKEDSLALQNHKLFEEEISGDFILHQGIYREVRCITPEDQLTNWAPNAPPNHKGYIMLGFKSLDNSFNQVMVDSWKDWTGARYIYMYLPDVLGLAKITFYHREAPDSLDSFMYIVLVECHTITTPERQMLLLDFAQRMRVERMSGYVSVYGEALS